MVRRLRLGALAGSTLMAACAFLPSAADAQQHADTSSLCWRARPLAACRHFTITEVGGRAYDGFDTFGATFALGVMRNVNERQALGGVLQRTWSAHTGGEEQTIELQARWQHFLFGRDALVLSAGPVIARDPKTDTPSDFDWGVDGVAASAGYSWAGLLMATVEVDSGSDDPLSIGLRTQSYLIALPLAVVAATIALFAGVGTGS